MEKKKGIAGVLKEFFGARPKGMDYQIGPPEWDNLPYDRQVAAGGLKGFIAEVKRLSESEKLELAQLAAKEIGLTQDQVEFSLT